MANTPLREAIAASGLRMHQVAARVGVDSSVVSRWASGDRMPKVHHAQALARELHTTVDTLFPAEPERAAA